MAGEDRSEAALERRVLLEFGRLQRIQPDMICTKVEVGVGYRGALLPALQRVLAPFGREVVAAALGEVKKHYLAYGQPGYPDLSVVAGGRWTGWELKTEVGRLSPVQEEWHAAARRRGCLVEVIRSVDEVAPALVRARLGAAGGAT